MTSDFVAIDHKDESPEYRQQVWAAVAQRVHSELTPLEMSHRFSGVWDVASDLFGSRSPAFVYRFNRTDEVEVECVAGVTDSTSRSTWKIPRAGAITIHGESYHAAKTDDGQIVIFNGDQSLVLVATQRRE